MHFVDALIPIFLFAVVGAVFVIAFITRHRERMTMVEKGLSPEDIKALYQRSISNVSPLKSLKWGMVFVGIGLAVLTGLVLDFNFHLDETVYPALIFLFGGIALIVFYAFARKQNLD